MGQFDGGVKNEWEKSIVIYIDYNKEFQYYLSLL